MRSVVFVTKDIGYCFLINGDSDLDYVKTTNGGLSWGGAVDVFTGTVEAFDVWYDQWTPGDTGRIIHIWYIQGGTGDDVLYTRLNTVDDIQTDITVISLTSTAIDRGQFVSGTKARGGHLFCAFDIDNGAEHGLYRSTDNGVTWGSRTDPVEAADDQCFLFPANAADANDIWMLYQDASTNELTVKTHDDSANTNSESAALTMVEETTDLLGQYGFNGAIRHQDGHLIFAFFNAYDEAGEDFLCYDWDGTTATALTALTTDIDDMYYPAVYLNQDQPDWIYIAYIGKSDGLEALQGTIGIYYALSKNRGLTWTKDIPYSTGTSSDPRETWVPLNGERFYVVWMSVLLELLSNNDNSKEFGFTGLNNYQFPRAVGVKNTGIISINGGG